MSYNKDYPPEILLQEVPVIGDCGVLAIQLQMLQEKYPMLVNKGISLCLLHAVRCWIFPADASLQLDSAEDHENCSEECDAVEDGDESNKDSVAEVVAVWPVGHADAEDGRDEEEDSKDADGGGEPNKEVAPEVELIMKMSSEAKKSLTYLTEMVEVEQI